jgi:hypothetical protein
MSIKFAMSQLVRHRPEELSKKERTEFLENRRKLCYLPNTNNLFIYQDMQDGIMTKGEEKHGTKQLNDTLIFSRNI